MKKVAIICGISGQDGGYLANFLLEKDYEVWGTSRDAEGTSFSNLEELGIKGKVKLLSMQPEDYKSVWTALRKSEPDELYFLAGQSSVGLSFELPTETIQSILLGMLNVLEACKALEKQVRVYNAGSSECFGDTKGVAATELTPFQPRSPYAVAKASAFWLVNNYREAYGLFACTGIQFNHESTFRPVRFVTQKIISTARRIASGSGEKLLLGRLDISRDWGWSPEYVEAMWLMLQQEQPDDFIIATGELNSLEDFVDAAFSQHGLSWKEHVIQDEKFMRPTDIEVSFGDPTKAKKILNWSAKYKMHDVVKMMT